MKGNKPAQRRRHRQRVREYLNTTEYLALKYSVITKRVGPLPKNEMQASKRLNWKIHLIAQQLKIKEKPMMIPVARIKIKTFIKEKATGYISRLII